ncbi:E3 ubiquitin-protein ligase CHFR-like [Anneissia japonica]|uniref:E3 ubiquitin-protein ligase CHFR-like n=1 Tax=Anneissia japonica TaxID=1529436 RepID=UPI001425B894|nr:E3 ubiquitin-protein ligase CHFR-like [Anneissia japonica]
MDDDANSYWSQLVCSTDMNAPILYIRNASFTIGRSKDCDLRIENNLISGRHCCIFKDSDNVVWLQDSSTNGTMLNHVTRITKGQKHRLTHGDEIQIVHKKDSPDSNVAYLYQDMVELQKEESNDSGLQKTDCTLEYDIDSSTVASPVRVLEEEQVPNAAIGCPPPVKKMRLGEAIPEDQKTAQETGQSKDIVLARITPGEGSSGQGPSGEPASDKDNEAGPSVVNQRDDMEETLLCSICYEILHNAVSLQPCMHTFCAACYSSWMIHSKDCPSCRVKVNRISYNHIVKNLVEVYLKKHPHKQRSEEEIKELDAKNQLTNDMLYPRCNNSDDDTGNSYVYISDSDDSDTSQPYLNIGFGSIFGRPGPVCKQCPNYVPPPHQRRPPNTTASSTTSTTPAVSTAAIATTTATAETSASAQASTQTTSRVAPSGQVVPMPVAPQYSCGANANHLVCMCCMDHMPDRRNDRWTTPRNVPPQQCSYCNRFFCHMYWGCFKPQCLGCLNQLKDLKFSQDCTRNLVNNNPYESEILMNYIQDQNISYMELFQQCLRRMDSNRYRPPSQMHHQTTSSSVFCYVCGLKVFKELAYLYRKDIPQRMLPNDVTSRPNCHWGVECRTQFTRPHHARNFNHICDKTRWS